MKVVYIAAPLGSGFQRDINRARAERWVSWAGEQGVAPVATWTTLAKFWPETRLEQGLAIDFALLERCDEVWLVGGRISPGMALELKHAQLGNVRVVDLTHLGEEPPCA